MSRPTSLFLACIAVVVPACAHGSATYERLPVASGDRAIVLGSREDAYYGGLALWQGFEHGWGYNHRINRIGSIVQQSGNGCPHNGDADPLCKVEWTNSAASGTGPDTAAVRTYMSLVSARNVGFGAASQEILIHGTEGQPIALDASIDVPLDGFTARQPQHVAILNGFDLLAMKSADKLVSLQLQLGEPIIEGAVAHVPVHIEGLFDCTSAECPSAPDVDYSLTLAVAVAGGADTAFTTSKARAVRHSAWDDKTELGADAGVPVPLESFRPRQDVLALRGFKVALDKEAHMLHVGLSVHSGGPGEPAHADLQFKNWREGMKQENPPASLTAYREAGSADWEADVVSLRFAEASVVPLNDEGRITWAGWGAGAATPLATRTNALLFALQAAPPTPMGDSALELAGITLMDVGTTRGAFDPILKLLKLGRMSGPLVAYCDALAAPATASTAPSDLLGRLTQVLGIARMLEDAVPKALAAKPLSDPDGGPAPTDARIVYGRDTGVNGSGVVYVRSASGGADLVGEDWAVDAAGSSTAVNGTAFATGDGATWDGGTIRFRGTLLQEERATGVTGTLAITGGSTPGLVADVAGPCGDTIKIEGALKRIPGCAKWDGAAGSATLTMDGLAHPVIFDDMCDGCATIDGRQVCE